MERGASVPAQAGIQHVSYPKTMTKERSFRTGTRPQGSRDGDSTRRGPAELRLSRSLEASQWDKLTANC
jgi:hypothetical protein